MNVFRNIFSDMIDKNRPAEPEPVVLATRSNSDKEVVVPNRSPRWQRSTKQTITISFCVLIVICVFLLRNMIAPLILAAILTYFMNPATRFIVQKAKISWKLAVFLVYFLFVVIFIGLLTWGGISLAAQIQNLFSFLSSAVDDLPATIETWLSTGTDPLSKYLLSLYNTGISTQLTDSISSLIKGLAGRVGSLAQSVSSTIAWFFFIIGFSFFLVWESGGKTKVSAPVFHVDGYDFDIEMGRYQLSRIWNGFVRGQVSLMGITIVVYTILFGGLQVHYAFLLACAAALTRLVPYVGSFVAWAAVALVCFFQGETVFGLLPVSYMILVVGLAFLIDKFMDGFIQPKFLADTLKVHPAFVLATALVCARIMGVLGIFLAAPVVATLKLLFRYILRKLTDQDPWEGIETVEAPVPFRETLQIWKEKVLGWWNAFCQWLKKLLHK